MQVSTGREFEDVEAARAAGIPEDDLVEVHGTPTARAKLRRRLKLASQAEQALVKEGQRIMKEAKKRPLPRRGGRRR